MKTLVRQRAIEHYHLSSAAKQKSATVRADTTLLPCLQQIRRALGFIFMTSQKFTFLISFHLFAIVSCGQTINIVDSLTNKFIFDLGSKNIDTVCVYQDYCVGCEDNFSEEDKCDYDDGIFLPTYIFWLEEGKTYMTEKDNCFDYSTILLQKSDFWKFYFTNQDTIKKAEIKEAEVAIIENGKQKNYSVMVDHSGHQQIMIFINQDTIINKDINDFYFRKEIGYKKERNNNYEYNTNSILNKFAKAIWCDIKVATKNQPLKKTRR